MFNIVKCSYEAFISAAQNKSLVTFGIGYRFSEFCEIFPELAEKISFCVDNFSARRTITLNGRDIQLIYSRDVIDRLDKDTIFLITPDKYEEIINELNKYCGQCDFDCYVLRLIETTYDSDVLHRIQQTEFDILKEFKRVCEINSLRYYLVGGTLLGAVRHGGFIPWDDDIDVAMPRRDFNEFVGKYCRQLGENYFLHWINSDDSYWLPFAKIRKNGTVFEEKRMRRMEAHKGIFIDIFPLDDALSVNSEYEKERALILSQLNTAILKKRGLLCINDDNIGDFGNSDLRSLILYRDELMQAENQKNGDFYINLGSNYDKVRQTMPKSVYDEPTELSFSGVLFKAPGDYDYVLRRIYGEDYMKLPPEEKRVTHCPVRVVF